MLDLEEKKLKIIVILATLIGILIYYFYPKDEYVMEMVKPSRPLVEKIEETPKKENFVIPKVVEEKKENIVEEKQIIEKGNILFTETDSTGRYTIQLLNAIDINLKKNDNSRNITIFGQIEDNSEKTEFSISIGEEYINYLSDLKIKILDSANNVLRRMNLATQTHKHLAS